MPNSWHSQNTLLLFLVYLFENNCLKSNNWIAFLTFQIILLLFFRKERKVFIPVGINCILILCSRKKFISPLRLACHFITWILSKSNSNSNSFRHIFQQLTHNYNCCCYFYCCLKTTTTNQLNYYYTFSPFYCPKFWKAN